MKWIALLFLLLNFNTALATQETQPLLRGGYQKIIAAHSGRPFIVAMWSLTCTHCVADMEIFKRLAKKYSSFDLVLISTDTPEREAEIAHTLKQYHLGPPEAKQKRRGKVESWVFGDSFAERLRFEIDAQWYGELPRTYFYDAAGKGRGISGVLDANETELWINNLTSKP